MCVFIQKKQGFAKQPLDFRGLSILSAVYRTWSKLRLADVQPWVQTWRTNSLYAGLPGQSAADAWQALALRVEAAKADQQTMCMSMIDMYKCFDQCNRAVVYLAMAKAGMPVRVLTAYMAFMETC
eukprot:12272189-Alexandrium_andersonii.AAC.1